MTLITEQELSRREFIGAVTVPLVVGSRARAKTKIPPAVLSPAMCGYLAGLFDGEGSVFVAGNGTVRIKVANTNRTLCELFLVFGGGVYTSHKEGDDRHLKPSHHRPRQHLWVWQGAGRSARAMMAACEPYLRLKSIRAVLVEHSARGVKIG